MAQKANLAYDLSVFETAQPKPKRQQQPIRKLEKKHDTQYIRPYKSILLIIVAAAITSFMVFSMMQLTEINEQIIGAEEQLQAKQSEAVRLDLELNQLMSISQLEQNAEALGMVKMDTSQIEYITLSQGNSIEIINEQDVTFFESIRTAFTNFVEYLTG